MEFKDRLKELIDLKEITPYRIGEDTTVSKQSIMNYLSGKTIPSGDALKVLSEYLNVSIDYLMDNEVIKITHLDEKIEGNISDSIPMIPFEAIAGYSITDNEGIELTKYEQYQIPEFKKVGVEFLIRVSGSSMYPKYSNGDILALKRIKDILFFQWGKVYVIDSSQGVLVKRIFEDKENKDFVLCSSDNKEHYPPFSIPKSDIRSLSIVVGVIRME
jgi:phage repressor protein C with HTH and peptisase S24 domain